MSTPLILPTCPCAGGLIATPTYTSCLCQAHQWHIGDSIHDSLHWFLNIFHACSFSSWLFYGFPSPQTGAGPLLSLHRICPFCSLSRDRSWSPVLRAFCSSLATPTIALPNCISNPDLPWHLFPQPRVSGGHFSFEQLSLNISKNKVSPLLHWFLSPSFFSDLGGPNFSGLQVLNHGLIKIFFLEFVFHTQTEYSMQSSSSNCYSCTSLFSCLSPPLKHAYLHEFTGPYCWGPVNGFSAFRFSLFGRYIKIFLLKSLSDHPTLSH